MRQRGNDAKLFVMGYEDLQRPREDPLRDAANAEGSPH